MQTHNDAKETYDLQIALGEKRIPCHKGILTVKSEYFRDIFKINKKVNMIILKEQQFNQDVLKKIILYIYGMEIKISRDIKELILYMKHLFLLQVKDLKKKIAQYCISIINNQNVCKLYNAAHLYDEHELED